MSSVASFHTSPSAAVPPTGCATTLTSSFQILTYNASSHSKRDLVRRQSTSLIATLNDGLLLDAQHRQGYISSDRQFEFNSPPPSDALYVDGFSVCSTGGLAIGNSTSWFECLNGNYYNIYTESISSDCFPLDVECIITPATGQTTSSSVSSSTSSQTSPTASSTSTPSPTAPAPASTATPESDALSSGAKAGIGVGVALAVLALIALGVWLLRRAKKPKPVADDDVTANHIEKAEFPSDVKAVPEADSTAQMHEMSGQGVAVEADAHEIHELDGNWHGHEVPSQK